MLATCLLATPASLLMQKSQRGTRARGFIACAVLLMADCSRLAAGLVDPDELQRRLEAIEHRQSRLEAQVMRRLPAVKDQGASPASTHEAVREGHANPAATLPSSPAPSGYAVGSDASLRASWKNGLFLESAHGDFQSHWGAQLNLDWVFFDQDAALRSDPTIGDLDDGVFFRRARFIIDGRAWENVEWYFEPEFGAASTITFGAAWIGLREVPHVGNVRVGNVKQAMGLESNGSSRFLTFMEAGITYDAFHQEYDPGLWMEDSVLDDRMTWALGFYRIDPDDDGIDFGDGEYAAAVRLTALAWYDEPSDGRYCAHLGASFSHRDAEFDPAAGTDVVRLRARPEVRAATLLPRFVDAGRMAADGLDMAGAEAAVVHGPLSCQAECVIANANDVVFPAIGGTPRGDVCTRSFYAFVSWFLTGEHRPYNRKTGAFGRVIPIENFWAVRGSGGDAACFGRGAWEIAARYSHVDLNDSGVSGGCLDDVTLGVNWYLNQNTKVQWNCLWIDRAVAQPAASGQTLAVAMRFAIDL